jgi:hypothetical protein
MRLITFLNFGGNCEAAFRFLANRRAGTWRPSYGKNQLHQPAIHGQVAEKFDARRLDLRHLA